MHRLSTRELNPFRSLTSPTDPSARYSTESLTVPFRGFIGRSAVCNGRENRACDGRSSNGTVYDFSIPSRKTEAKTLLDFPSPFRSSLLPASRNRFHQSHSSGVQGP